MKNLYFDLPKKEVTLKFSKCPNQTNRVIFVIKVLELNIIIRNNKRN